MKINADKINELAQRAGLLEHTPGLTLEAATYLLGIRGARARALGFWRKGAWEVEVERVRAFLPTP